MRAVRTVDCGSSYELYCILIEGYCYASREKMKMCFVVLQPTPGLFLVFAAYLYSMLDQLSSTPLPPAPPAAPSTLTKTPQRRSRSHAHVSVAHWRHRVERE